MVCMRWYAAYPLSLRNLEEMMAERGVIVDHATVHCWALKISAGTGGGVSTTKAPGGIELARRRNLYQGRRSVGVSVSRRRPARPTVDLLLTAKRDVAAARRFFERAIDRHDVPEKITIDRSGANTAAVYGLMAEKRPPAQLQLAECQPAARAWRPSWPGAADPDRRQGQAQTKRGARTQAFAAWQLIAGFQIERNRLQAAPMLGSSRPS